jgi:hypothetical protein
MHNVMGCCGTALQWEANLGARMGAMIASVEAPLRRLQEFRFKQDFLSRQTLVSAIRWVMVSGLDVRRRGRAHGLRGNPRFVGLLLGTDPALMALKAGWSNLNRDSALPE